MHYIQIVPKIIIEKCLGGNINDYKFLCYGGQPYYCWVDIDRLTDHKRKVYDLDWIPQSVCIGYKNCEEEVQRPKCFSEMLELVRKLCEGFDFVRVDLYEIDERVYFGEMTFTSGSGLDKIEPLEWDYKLGELWDFNSVLQARKRIKNCI